MSNALKLEEIVTIAKGVSEWNMDNSVSRKTTYTGVFTPNGSDKSMHVSVTCRVTDHYDMFGDKYHKFHYLGSLRLENSGIVELNEKQAKKVYAIAEKPILLKEAEAVDAELKKKDEEKRKKEEQEMATIREVKQVLSGDSTLCSLSPRRPWYRRLFK